MEYLFLGLVIVLVIGCHVYELIRKGRLIKEEEEPIPDGKHVEYYKSGQVEVEKNYIDNKKDGKWIWYFENGQIEQEGNYMDDKRNGKWVFYDETGKIKRSEYYENGKIKEQESY